MSHELRNATASFTAASTIPFKLFLNEEIFSFIETKRPIPLHIQLNPTNRCNQNCSFCSCRQRDKNKEIPLEKLLDIIEKMHRLGARAATITGGGEPTLYKNLNKTIEFLNEKNIQIGLVTNGLDIDDVMGALTKLTWCRFSLSDAQKIEDRFLKKLLAVKDAMPHVDYGFSYVVTRNFDPANLKKLIDFAQINDFSHVRIVSDLLDLETVPDISDFLKAFTSINGRIVYQRRTEYATGRNPCYLSLIKPNIGPDGNMYPCCGVQYAIPEMPHDFAQSMNMGSNIDDIYAHKRYFDGRICKRCYYDHYNQIIGLLIEGIKHKEFV